MRSIVLFSVLLSKSWSFQPNALNKSFHLTNRSRFGPFIVAHDWIHKFTSPLFNFLDDFKNEQEYGNPLGESTNFPPAICPTEIHRIRFSTTAGDFTVRLDRSLSPSGVTRFLELVDDGFFVDQLLYRVDPGFVIQFGVASTPEMHSRWDPNVGAPVPPLPDEPNRQEFSAGSVSFAGSGFDSRSCHIFIALEPGGATLGSASHETVLGSVESEDGGMLAVENIVRNREETQYGDLLGMQQALIREGNSALESYSGIDRFIACGRM
mmetsp:Transcript_33453/g.77144  ORF Transcript_33453/g.77144 Transcript_33453/m.77144 type:complete len:266 (-) Transcript_33453:530-1327(-)